TILATSRLLRRFATRRSRRIGLRISGEIEKNAPPDASDQIKDPHPPPRIKGAHLRDSSDNKATTCRGECNQDEVLVVAYCGPRRSAVTLVNERTVTCPRGAATSPLVVVCAKATQQ